jgi:hypothetical protein
VRSLSLARMSRPSSWRSSVLCGDLLAGLAGDDLVQRENGRGQTAVASPGNPLALSVDT